MCARDEIDRKNIETTNEIIKNYPKILKKYIDSLSRKTSYTKMVYARYICNFLDYANNELDININNNLDYAKIYPMDIDSYMESIKYKENGKEKSGMYRAAQLAAIHGFFTFLQKNNIINNNPCDTTEIPKDTNHHEIITISDDDLDIIISNINNGVGSNKAVSTQQKWINRDKALILLGITTGLRISAIVGIDIDDINFKERCITVTEKGDIPEIKYLGIKTIRAIQQWLSDRKYMVDQNEKALFICQTGHRISTRAVRNRFKQITQGTNKKITPHKMRATCATKLYEQTGDIYLVQQQLGHKNIENTKRYAKVSDSKMKEAANILNNIY